MNSRPVLKNKGTGFREADVRRIPDEATASRYYYTYKEQRTMKVAFTTSGQSLDAPLDSRFGRAAKFLVYDIETGTIDIVDNEQNLNAPQGAGIQAAQTVARLGVDSIVTGHCGPKAFHVLSTAGVRVYTSDAVTIAEALEALRSGTLESIDSADVEGHWI